MSLKINSDIIKRKIMTVCIGNASGYGQTPNAVPYNGLLDVSVVYHPEMTQLLKDFICYLQVNFSIIIAYILIELEKLLLMKRLRQW